MTASEKILMKSLVTSGLDSRQWNSIQAGLRDRAFFSSQVESARILHAARQMTAQAAAGGISASEFRREMRKALAQDGYEPSDPRFEGTIKDLRTKQRLDLILKTNVEQARGYIRHLEATTPGGFAAFPAQELIRVRQRRQPRDWRKKWADAGGKIFGGRMIALKDDPVWTRISRFGTPYPPFDFGSGMGVRGVSRKDAIALGVIVDEELKEKVDEIRKTPSPGFNEGLEAEIPFKGNTREMKALRDAFGDQITHADGVVKWRGSIVRDAFISGNDFELRLGKPTQKLLGMLSQEERRQIGSKSFTVTSGWLGKPREEGGDHRGHFYPLENDPRNIPLTDGDLDLIPSLWRNPDRVDAGGIKGSVVCSLECFDKSILRMVVDISRVPRLKTMYKNKPGMGSGGLT